MTTESVQSRSFGSAYLVGLNYTISEDSTSKNPIEDTIASLLSCREDIFQSNVTANQVWSIIALTQDVIAHLETQNQAQYSVLSGILSIGQRALGPINQLQKYKTELEQELKSTERRTESSMRDELSKSSPNLLFLGLHFYTASPNLRKTALFLEAKTKFKAGFAKALLEKAITPDILYQAKEIDPYHEWIHDLANLHPNETLINAVMKYIHEEVASHEPLTDSDALLHLFARMDNSVRHLSKTDAFKLVSSLIHISSQLIQKKPLTLSWQEVTQDIIPRFIFTSADIGIKHRNVLSTVESGLAYLISKDSECSWLRYLMLYPQTYAFTSHIAEILDAHTFASSDTSQIHSIMRRYWQIAAVPEEIRKLPKFQMLRLAYFIETVMRQEYISKPPEYPSYPHFEKSDPILQGGHNCPQLGLSIEQDLTTGRVFLLLPRAGSHFQGDSGAIKKPRHTIVLPTNAKATAEVLCRTVNHSFVSKKPAGARIARDLCIEASFQQKLRGQRGIWPLDNYFEYTTTKQGQLVYKVSIYSKLADKKVSHYTLPLHPRSENPEHLKTYEKELATYNAQMKQTPLSSLLKMLLDLAHGLNDLHENNQYHLDVKPRNAFVELNDKEEIVKAGWSDFGHSNPQSDDYKACIPYGTYGTILYSAPELMGKKNFAGNHKALDVWAFGCMLFEVFKKQQPFWISDVLDLVPDNNPLLIKESDISSVKALIERDIEEPFKKLNPSSRNVDERINHLIFGTLRLDPENRLTMAQVIQALVAIGQLKYGPGQIQ